MNDLFFILSILIGERITQ